MWRNVWKKMVHSLPQQHILELHEIIFPEENHVQEISVENSKRLLQTSKIPRDGCYITIMVNWVFSFCSNISIYNIKHNSFWISKLSFTIYDWNPFLLIQRLRFHLRLFFSPQTITSFFSKMWTPHKLWFNGQKTFKVGITKIAVHISYDLPTYLLSYLFFRL